MEYEATQGTHEMNSVKVALFRDVNMCTWDIGLKVAPELTASTFKVEMWSSNKLYFYFGFGANINKFF
jgi:hypothetical protein